MFALHFFKTAMLYFLLHLLSKDWGLMLFKHFYKINSQIKPHFGERTS